MIQKLLTVFLVFGVTACGGSENGAPLFDGDDGGLGDGGDEITFSNSVGSVFQAKCARCHGAYGTYDGVVANIEGIAFRALEVMNMPPRSQPQLTDEEKELMAIWIEEGLRE